MKCEGKTTVIFDTCFFQRKLTHNNLGKTPKMSLCDTEPLRRQTFCDANHVNIQDRKFEKIFMRRS